MLVGSGRWLVYQFSNDMSGAESEARGWSSAGIENQYRIGYPPRGLGLECGLQQCVLLPPPKCHAVNVVAPLSTQRRNLHQNFATFIGKVG